MTREETPWRPLLGGPTAERAREAIRAIAEALREPRSGWSPGVSTEVERQVANACLGGGAAGVALFYAYLARTGEDRWVPLASSHLERAMETVGTVPMSPALYGGFSGVAWTVQHLARQLQLAEGDPVEGVDEALRDLLAQPRAMTEYDLISGPVGLGLYALERLPRPMAAECLSLALDRLEELAEPVGPGIAWPKVQPQDPDRLSSYDGRYNLGVAHGTPGVIALLALTWAAVPALRPKAEKLLAPAVAFLLAQRLPGPRGPRFPYAVGDGVPVGPARCAWCYGDSGIARTLHLAARCVGEPSWEDAALEVAREAAELTPEQAKVVDAGLCHGAAGLAHMLNRLWQETGDERFRAAATRWFEHALSYRKADRGIGGFQALVGQPVIIVDEPGFLMGGAGVGLALLAALGDQEPGWDRVLALSRRLDGPWT